MLILMEHCIFDLFNGNHQKYVLYFIHSSHFRFQMMRQADESIDFTMIL